MKKHIMLIPISVWIFFIYFNSLQNADLSGANSGWVLDFVLNLFSKFSITLDPINTHYFIRKSAHVTEFFILASLFTIYFKNYNLSKMYKLIYSLSLPLIVAIIDEVIQTYVPGRAGLFSDVIIDSIGIILGYLTTIFIYYILRKKNKQKEL